MCIADEITVGENISEYSVKQLFCKDIFVSMCQYELIAFIEMLIKKDRDENVDLYFEELPDRNFIIKVKDTEERYFGNICDILYYIPYSYRGFEGVEEIAPVYMWASEPYDHPVQHLQEALEVLE